MQIMVGSNTYVLKQGASVEDVVCFAELVAVPGLQGHPEAARMESRKRWLLRSSIAMTLLAHASAFAPSLQGEKTSILPSVEEQQKMRKGRWTVRAGRRGWLLLPQLYETAEITEMRTENGVGQGC